LFDASLGRDASHRSFATQQTFATGGLPLSVTAADVNGDGLPDLIVANHSGDTASAYVLQAHANHHCQKGARATTHIAAPRPLDAIKRAASGSARSCARCSTEMKGRDGSNPSLSAIESFSVYNSARNNRNTRLRGRHRGGMPCP
jgi:FG-GAP repeat